MVDPIAVVTLASSIINKCYKYGCSVSDAPDEAKRLAAETTNLSGLLVGLQGLAGQHEGYLRILDAPKILLECSADLKAVDSQLEGLVSVAGQTKSQRIAYRLKWPLKRGDTLKLIESVERQKSTLSILLESFTTTLLSEQQSEVQKLSSAFQSLDARIAGKEEVDVEQEILNWICHYNYQAQHHRAWNLHCENTSAWILEHPLFRQWMEATNQVLWFRGGPGAGKTILASFVVEHLLQSSAIDGNPVVFFYFDKSTDQSLSFHTFLASVLRQLCTQMGIPGSVEHLFSAAKLSSGGLRPITLNQLTSMVRQIMASDRPPVVVVDGMDEAEDITDICDFLITLTESKTKFFISSRPHNVTANALKGALKMSPPSASASSDISQYINHRLGHDQRLRKMSESLQSYVRKTLGEKAAGMFRWVQCQLDEISNLRTDRAIKIALKTLPETLEASYSRNVLRISESDVPFAYRALLWLTYALFPLKLTALAEAAILEPNTTAVDDESRLSDPTDILDICGMLASYNDLSDEIQLSHHSVREFLSINCKIPFSFPEKQSHQTIAECCISYLLNSDFQAGAMASPQLLRLAFAKYPLLAYAARIWPEHVLRSGAEEALQPLILKLLTPEPTPHFYLWLQVILYYSSHGFEVPGTRPDYNPTPLYYASSYGLYHTVKSLIVSGADLNVRAGQYGGTAYHAACWRRRPQIGKLLLEAGIDATIQDNNGMTAFDLIGSFRFEDVAKVAVQHYQGVTLNPVVDNALRAMYSVREARESKEKKLREFNASTSNKVISAKCRKPNPHLPRNSREVKDGEALELE